MTVWQYVPRHKLTCLNLALLAAMGLDNLLIGGNHVLIISGMTRSYDSWGTPIMGRGFALLALAIFLFARWLRAARRARAGAEARPLQPKPRMVAAVRANHARRLARRLMLYAQMKRYKAPEDAIEQVRARIEDAIRKLPAAQALSVIAASRGSLARLRWDEVKLEEKRRAN
jgi:hypothetical protein